MCVCVCVCVCVRGYFYVVAFNAIFFELRAEHQNHFLAKQTELGRIFASTTILRDFKNAPFYILCLFHMINLRMYSLSFLSSCKMDHDLPLFRFAHAVHSDVIST